MKKTTIELPDDLAEQARLCAAQRGTSLLVVLRMTHVSLQCVLTMAYAYCSHRIAASLASRHFVYEIRSFDTSEVIVED